MYEYKETLSQPDISKLKINNTDIEIQLDEFPIQRPFIPRIDGRQAHLFLWLGKKEEDIPELTDYINSKIPNKTILKDRIILRTMRYVKRQLTWSRGNMQEWKKLKSSDFERFFNL